MSKTTKTVLGFVCAFMILFGVILGVVLCIMKPVCVKMYKEYKFQGIEFEKEEDLVFDDIAKFVPTDLAGEGENAIDTIEEFEAYLLNNIRSFTFEREEDGEKVTVDARPKDSLKFIYKFHGLSEGIGVVLRTKTSGKKKDFWVLRKGSHTLVGNPEIRFINGDRKKKIFYYCGLNHKFALRYVYELR